MCLKGQVHISVGKEVTWVQVQLVARTTTNLVLDIPNLSQKTNAFESKQKIKNKVFLSVSVIQLSDVTFLTALT